MDTSTGALSASRCQRKTVASTPSPRFGGSGDGTKPYPIRTDSLHFPDGRSASSFSFQIWFRGCGHFNSIVFFLLVLIPRVADGDLGLDGPQAQQSLRRPVTQRLLHVQGLRDRMTRLPHRPGCLTSGGRGSGRPWPLTSLFRQLSHQCNSTNTALLPFEDPRHDLAVLITLSSSLATGM